MSIIFARRTDTPKVIHGMILAQPWARLVAEGVIPVLVRPRPVTMREEVAIVARGVDPWATIDGRVPGSKGFPQPAVIGYVRIAGCLGPIPKGNVKRELSERYGKEFAEFYPKHYYIGASTFYFWLLRKPIKLKRPREIQVGRHRGWIRFE